MRSAVRTLAGSALLAMPAVLAFFTGGYLDEARAWAGLVAWLLVAVGVAVGELPRGRNAALALGGSLAFALWTLWSVTWAPLSSGAWDAAQIALLYAGVMAAGAMLLGARSRLVEPALLAGTVVVVGYGLLERVLPGVFEFAQSVSAQGRLEQPLTYWNGMGVVAAMGIVLAARIVGDIERPRWVRSAAAAASAPLALGLSLTVSRGALLACAAGLVALVVLVRRREQLAAVVGVVAVGLAAALVAARFDWVTSLSGDHHNLDGGIVLLAVLILMGVAAFFAPNADRHAGVLKLPRNAGVIALMAIGVGVGGAILVGTDEKGPRELTPDAARLVTLKSNRYEYWRVAARAFEDQPIRGVGAGGWSVRWLAERPFRESASDAHSLYLQTAAELGLIGLFLLGVWFAGVGLAARAGPPGLTAVCAVWAVHVLLDWDFELPAATLPAMIAAGVLVAQQPQNS